MMKRIIVITLLAAAAGLAQTVDCIVAVVNGAIITRLDVEVTAEFGLGYETAAQSDRDPRLEALDALIDRKVVLDLTRQSGEAGGEEIAGALAELRRRMGEEAFGAKLRKFGLVEKHIETYLVDRILFDKAMALRFSPTIPVSLTDVERHYRDTYVPGQARRGLAAEPIDRVAGQIESRIRDERRTKQMSDWVKDLRKRADIQIRTDCLK
jgi:hypothetical protein